MIYFSDVSSFLVISIFLLFLSSFSFSLYPVLPVTLCLFFTITRSPLNTNFPLTTTPCPPSHIVIVITLPRLFFLTRHPQCLSPPSKVATTLLPRSLPLPFYTSGLPPSLPPSTLHSYWQQFHLLFFLYTLVTNYTDLCLWLKVSKQCTSDFKKHIISLTLQPSLHTTLHIIRPHTRGDWYPILLQTVHPGTYTRWSNTLDTYHSLPSTPRRAATCLAFGAEGRLYYANVIVTGGSVGL